MKSNIHRVCRNEINIHGVYVDFIFLFLSRPLKRNTYLYFRVCTFFRFSSFSVKTSRETLTCTSEFIFFLAVFAEKRLYVCPKP
jgi:hypothetical protein